MRVCGPTRLAVGHLRPWQIPLVGRKARQVRDRQTRMQRAGVQSLLSGLWRWKRRRGEKRERQKLPLQKKKKKDRQRVSMC